jgi:GTPase
VPYALEVEVAGIAHRAPTWSGSAVVLTDTESQKGILFGADGKMIKAIGVAAQRAIECELGSDNHRDPSVSVRRHSRAVERLLDRLGIE